MGEYTVSLRYLIERGYKLALDSYPIWDEEYRPYLNQKIIDHYYFREIGQETPDRFNFFLRRKMNEIMPYYNKLYESELIEFDPLATEFFKEGTDTRRNREYESASKNKGKRGETVGEIYSSNEDGKLNTIFGQTSTENVVGDYRKQGDKNVDTVSKKTEDFTEKTVSTKDEDFKQDTTSTKNEDFTQDVVGNTLTTTDMHTKTVSNSDSTGTKKTTGNTFTTFSDIPQAGIETTEVIAPDGTITRTTKGYATTTTDVSLTENVSTTDHNTTTTNTDNTGTVKTDTTEKTTNDNVTNTTENKTNDNTTAFDQTKTNKNVTDFTENEATTWHESGDHTQDTGYKNDEDTDTKTNTKRDSERNTATNVRTGNNHSERSKTGENVSEVFTGKGRKGSNPSDLIQKYRNILLNIDMMVIDELETLFMGVY